MESLNYWLARFVVEIRREDGQPYPPSSVNGIRIKACVPAGSPCPNFMDRKDPSFRDLTGAMQVGFCDLRVKGVGSHVKYAPVVTPDEEDKFWEVKVLGVDSPVALQRAVFYYVGKVFCLRGREEQRGLKPSQFVRSTNRDCYTYIEKWFRDGYILLIGFLSNTSFKTHRVHECAEFVSANCSTFIP